MTETSTDRERLAAAIRAYTVVADDPPGGLIMGARAEMHGDPETRAAGQLWREQLYQVGRALVAPVEAALRAGLDEEVRSQLATARVEIVRNGRKDMLRLPGGSGWFLWGRVAQPHRGGCDLRKRRAVQTSSRTGGRSSARAASC